MPIPLLELTHKLGLFEATLGTIDLLVPLSLSRTTKGLNLGCHKKIFVLFLFTFANKSKTVFCKFLKSIVAKKCLLQEKVLSDAEKRFIVRRVEVLEDVDDGGRALASQSADLGSSPSS